MSTFSEGDKVTWNWGNGTASGRIVEKYVSEVEKTLKGTSVKRNASEDDPAYLIEQDDGDQVLKSGTELTKK